MSPDISYRGARKRLIARLEQGHHDLNNGSKNDPERLAEVVADIAKSQADQMKKIDRLPTYDGVKSIVSTAIDAHTQSCDGSAHNKKTPAAPREVNAIELSRTGGLKVMGTVAIYILFGLFILIILAGIVWKPMIMAWIEK